MGVRTSWAIVVICVIYVTGYNYRFLTLDTLPPVLDAAFNYDHVRSLLTLIVDPSVRIHSLLKVLLWGNAYPYPPGYFLTCLLLEPLGLLSEQYAALMTHAHFLGLIIGSALLGGKLGGPVARSISAIITTFTPAFLAFSREVMLDLPLTLWVVVTYYELMTFTFPLTKLRSVAMGATWGVGLLYKQSFPLYVLPGFLVLSVDILRSSKRKPAVQSLIVAATACLVTIIPYYVTHLTQPFSLVSSFKSVLLENQSITMNPLKITITYILQYPKMLSWPFLLLGCLGAALTIRTQRKHWSWLLLWGIIPLWISGFLFPVMNWRYVLPSLPGIVTWLALTISNSRTRFSRPRLRLGSVIIGGIMILGLTNQWLTESLRVEVLPNHQAYYDRIYVNGARTPAQPPIALPTLLATLHRIDLEQPIESVAMIPNIPIMSGISVVGNEFFKWNPSRFTLVIGGKLDNGFYIPEMQDSNYWSTYLASFDVLITMNQGDFTDGRHRPGSLIHDSIITPALAAAEREYQARPLVLILPRQDSLNSAILVYGRRPRQPGIGNPT